MSDNDNNSCSMFYIYGFCIAYVLLQILYQLWIIIDVYVLPNYRQPRDFKSYGQWAVITGSTDGIGKEFARQLASKGVDVCLISRNEEKLKNTAKEIEESFGVKTKYIVADFTDANIYSNIRKNLADMDVGILVNNVGMATEILTPYSDHSEELIKSYVNVNILSALMMTSVVLPCMIAKKKGLIVNISSAAAYLVCQYSEMYISSKACLNKFGECLSYDLSKYNIEVKTLAPGHVDTNMVTKHKHLRNLISKIPIDINPSVKIYVDSALKTLNSRNSVIQGYFNHHIELMLVKILPVPAFGLLSHYFYRNK